jgi:DMSO/TMAO reductase YedYZ molybdopterin-dependent catalytic subunit
MRLSRRAFLDRAARAGALGLAAASLPAWLHDAAATSATGSPADLIERNAWPEHWETGVGALGRSFLTPANLFFVRSHLPVPDLDPDAHRFRIAGGVGHERAWTLAELRKLPATELTVTLECAGNGRGLMKLANTSGTQWGLGAVGTARWRGVRLADLLERAGVHADARHVWMEAADRGVLPAVPNFLRSIPLAVATGDVLVAYAMNGAPLPRLHGGPLRAIVPGWYGMASTKWLTGARLAATPSDGHFMIRGYRYVAPGGDPLTSPPVEEMRVKSLVTSPLERAEIPRGRVAVAGFAWAGPSGVRRVDVSTDDGATWQAARLEASPHRWAWRRWSASVQTPSGGSVAILARATDGAGATQPRVAPPNAAGYANNAMHRVEVFVRG